MASLISGFKDFYVKNLHPKKKKEGFDDTADTVGEVIGLIIAIILLIIIQIVLGKYLWNMYLIKFIPGIKPVNDYVDILALFVLVRLFI